MRTRAYVLVLVTAVVVGVALGLVRGHGESEPAASEAALPKSGLELLRQTMSYEYKPYAGPAEMLDHSAVAVVGRVHHLQTAIVKDKLDGSGALIVAIDPTEEWKGDARAADRLVYFVLPRPKNLGLKTYEQAMPAGTEIVLFGGIHGPSTDFTSGDPGVTTYVPDPQGLFIAQADSTLENVWAEELTDELGDVYDLESLRDATLGG